MKNLLGMTMTELQQVVAENDMPLYAAGQLADWLYIKQVDSIDKMTNISLKSRAKLSENYTVSLSQPVGSALSVDGTVKYLYEVEGGYFIESVFIPDYDRATLCISSQVGCKMGCVFCMTGRQRYSANLSTADILNQIISLPEKEALTNVVFMGMGEPFDNLDNVLKAIEIMTSDWGFGWSPRRITVSTVGMRRELKRFIEECDCHLAISLHASSPEKRGGLVPAEKAFSMISMIEVLKKYDFRHQRRLSFEYIMFDGVNDSADDADRLVRALQGLSCRVNLIRFHTIPDSPLRASLEERILQFRDRLTSRGIFTTVRASRGEDISAACGMLSTMKHKNQ